ncbi:unnamed protein product [Adineta ricciae]|nr:unnamed protein product [Adineta ricciae]
MRWSEGSRQGEVIVGRNGKGEESNQLSSPIGLSFDVEENLYGSDCENDRILRFVFVKILIDLEILTRNTKAN